VVDALEGSWSDYLVGSAFHGGQAFQSGELIWIDVPLSTMPAIDKFWLGA
jgi:hypothetical protein